MNRQSSSAVQPADALAADRFPFATSLGLGPIMQWWRERASAPNEVTAKMAQEVVRAFDATPELHGVIHDRSIFDRHRSLVQAIFGAMMPAAQWDSNLASMHRPLRIDPIVQTPAMAKAFYDARGKFVAQPMEGFDVMTTGRTRFALALILRKFYGISIPLVPMRIIYGVPDATLSGLERYFELSIDNRFTEIVQKRPVPALTEAERAVIFDNPSNPWAWLAVVPADAFEFVGVAYMRAWEVTLQEVVSRLMLELIDKDSITDARKFNSVQSLIRTLIRDPDAKIGLTVHVGETLVRFDAQDASDGYVCIATATERGVRSPFRQELIQRAADRRRFVFAHDAGRPLAVAPLVYQGEPIAFLDLEGGPKAHFDDGLNILLMEVLPLLTIAVRRASDEHQALVQRIIRDQCTAIHPSVQWAFERAANRMIRSGEDFENVVFRDVYPLYAVTDIRGSSSQRNSAIQRDLLDHLRHLGEILATADARRPMPIFAKLRHNVAAYERRLGAGLLAGDEMSVLGFVTSEIEPVLDHARSFDPAIATQLAAYRDTLSADQGGIYHARKVFDESVRALNDALSSYIDEEQREAQAIFPHYFEKHVTDGVDHGIYVGSEMVASRAFDPVYVRNLRLWQLIVMCGSARITHELKPKLSLPLDTAHLVVVQANPLSIRFDFDEKRFGVDGAYNIRYEIMKKRIDKAVVRGSGERLTQPGQIAIVYSQDKERQEYLGYVDYLQETGQLVAGEPEDLDLEDMQGIQGLRALRVKVRV